MMTSGLWRAAAILAPAAITMVTLATPAVASPAAASPSWTLTNEFASNPVCYTTSGGSEPLEINLSGTWSTSLTFGASGLPAGASSSDMILDENLTNDVWSTATPPIPPGWSNGTGPLAVGPETIAEAYADTTIPAGLKAGSTLTITIWASDGTTKQTESVPIVIKSSCVRHY